MMFIFLLVLLLVERASLVQGLQCLSCNDVLLPTYCQQTIQCGQGEVCSTREIIKQGGTRTYRMGCEDKRTCELANQASIIFGRRDVTTTKSPSDTCYECCSTGDCNKNLCRHTGTGSTTVKPGPDVTCMSCEDVASPEGCKRTTTCGHNDICFTREYVDHNGHPGYIMGCESEAMCTLFKKAQTLFGKRETSADALNKLCYDCCSTNGCNSGLCKPDCPAKFLTYKRRCYHFDFIQRNWTEARSYCKQHGADLVSIQSQEENNFLNKELISLNRTSIISFWTGGFYSNTTGGFKWSDGSSFKFTNWWPGQPRAGHSLTGDSRILVTNPVHGNYSTTMMFENVQSLVRGVICKTN